MVWGNMVYSESKYCMWCGLIWYMVRVIINILSDQCPPRLLESNRSCNMHITFCNFTVNVMGVEQ